jgi:hypothetical protein
MHFYVDFINYGYPTNRRERKKKIVPIRKQGQVHVGVGNDIIETDFMKRGSNIYVAKSKKISKIAYISDRIQRMNQARQNSI